MAKEEKIEMEGEVVEAFRSGMYKVLLENGQETLGYTAGCRRTTSAAAGSSTATGRRTVPAAAHEARRRQDPPCPPELQPIGAAAPAPAAGIRSLRCSVG